MHLISWVILIIMMLNEMFGDQTIWSGGTDTGKILDVVIIIIVH